MSNKVGYPLSAQVIGYDEQQQQQMQGGGGATTATTTNIQPSSAFNQFHQSMNVGGQVKATGPVMGGTHKKSNSLINSKMAQILLKGPAGGIIGNANNNISQHNNNQMLYQQQQQNQYLPQDGYKQQQQNNTSNSIVQGISHQTSFAHQQNDLISYSIDYQKPYFYDDYEDQSHQHSQLNLQNLQQQQQMFMNQVPSSKQILKNMNAAPINLEQFIQPANNDLSQMKKQQQATSTSQKNQQILVKGQSSAQKSVKKQSIAGSGHQRTKSDTYYNRGSITSQNKQALGQVQQQKRVSGNSNLILKNNFIETHDSRTIASQGIGKNLNGGMILLNTDQPHIRKAPGSAHHSKKPSTGSSIQSVPQSSVPSSQAKKSTREKYIELKALYNDLLERHFVQQQQYQQVGTGSKGFQQQPSSQNLINFYPNAQQQYMGTEVSSSVTPRITMTNQLSQSTINANLQYLNQEIQQKALLLQQQQIKSQKHTTNKLDSNLQDSIQIVQKSQQQTQIQPKAALKLQIAQGQSRKVVSQGNHKRSVSDGNEQLFKFKQQAMQRYLYPQPSNQTLQQTQVPLNTEETIGTQRSKQLLLQSQQQTPYQQSNHQRRVSDDYNQKQKKSQLNLQAQLIGSSSSVMQQNMGTKQPHHQQMMIVENVPNDYPETQKPATIDFNIKGFLLEMRNKHEKTGNGFINIVDEQQQQVTPSNAQRLAVKNGKQFAMIIEENSPSGFMPQDESHHHQHIGSLDSSRKMSLLDSQSQLILQQASKPNIELNKILNKYKQMKLGDKRASSPVIDIEPKAKAIAIAKKGLGQASHKRVKSDIPEMPRKTNPLVLGGSKPMNGGMIHKKQQQLAGSSNLVFNSDKNTPKKIFTKQQQFAFGLPNAQFDASSSKKVINVSIDLIKDAAELDQSNDSHAGVASHWQPVDESTQELNLDKVMAKKKTNAQSLGAAKHFSGFSGGVNDQRQDKYKKMAQRYDIDTNNVSGINKNKYTFDLNDRSAGPNTPSILSTPKGRFSIHDKPEMMGNKKPSTKQFMPQSPKQQTAAKANSSKFKASAQQSQKKIATQQQQIPLQQPQKAAPPNNSVVQTQESARNSLLLTPGNLNLQNLQHNQTISERIDTQDSDPNLSPRTKGVSKLMKHIKLSFRQTQLPPNTTVDFYRIGKVLGKGAFGKVNLALHKLTQKFTAVKSINKQYLSEDAQTKKVMQEVVILKRTRHRNIVRLYEFFETQKHILFVIELCAGGDLLNYVRRRRRLKEDVAKVVFKQIIEGLGYCHSKNILHRDIKLDNILLDSDGVVKICDFGVSKIVKKGEIMTEQCGTPAYIAPEILRDKGYEGFQVDVWSAGVVLYAMLYGTVPFKANNMSELQKLIIKAKYTLKDDISEEARELLGALLEKDPLKRLTIPQILKHKWLVEMDEAPIELFTDQEKEYIKNEFTYNDTERYNRNETDPFTEHMLDSTQNSMLKNQSTKSVVLAPFNSTKSNLCLEQPTLTESMRELLQTKRCIKFAARVRDVDRQYEMNNNADLDNGVYHKVEEDEKQEEKKENATHQSSDDSLQGSFNKETIRSEEDEEAQRIQKEKKKKDQKKHKKEKQTELEKLESLICQQEEQDNDDNPYGSKEEIYIKDQQQQQQQQSKRSPRVMPSEKLILQSAQTLIIEESAVSQIEQYGYPREYIVKSLNNNELNYATTSYYLLQNLHSLAIKGDEIKGKLTNRQIL